MTKVLDGVRATMASAPRLDLHQFPIELSYADGTLTLEGEVGDVAAKKLVLEGAAALPEVSGIVDRLGVQPAQWMGDGEIRDLVRDGLLQEPAFADFAIRTRRGERLETVREPAEARGAIEVEVEDGVVTLNGQVPGLDDKRPAGVFAWWVPGSRDVINGIAVEPPEDDRRRDPEGGAPGPREGSLRRCEPDPGRVNDALVRLTGVVPSEAERDMAELASDTTGAIIDPDGIDVECFRRALGVAQRQSAKAFEPRGHQSGSPAG